MHVYTVFTFFYIKASLSSENNVADLKWGFSDPYLTFQGIPDSDAGRNPNFYTNVITCFYFFLSVYYCV